MVRETGRFTRASTKPRVGLTRVTRRFACGRASCSCVSRGPIRSAAETMADNGSAAELNGMIGTPHARQVLVAEPRRGQPALLDILGPWAFNVVAGLFALRARVGTVRVTHVAGPRSVVGLWVPLGAVDAFEVLVGAAAARRWLGADLRADRVHPGLEMALPEGGVGRITAVCAPHLGLVVVDE
jgi:hypothetical protein